MLGNLLITYHQVFTAIFLIIGVYLVFKVIHDLFKTSFSIVALLLLAYVYLVIFEPSSLPQVTLLLEGSAKIRGFLGLSK
jgi:hypothetical protein